MKFVVTFLLGILLGREAFAEPVGAHEGAMIFCNSDKNNIKNTSLCINRYKDRLRTVGCDDNAGTMESEKCQQAIITLEKNLTSPPKVTEKLKKSDPPSPTLGTIIPAKSEDAKYSSILEMIQNAKAPKQGPDTGKLGDKNYQDKNGIDQPTFAIEFSDGLKQRVYGPFEITGSSDRPGFSNFSYFDPNTNKQETRLIKQIPGEVGFIYIGKDGKEYKIEKILDRRAFYPSSSADLEKYDLTKNIDSKLYKPLSLKKLACYNTINSVDEAKDKNGNVIFKVSFEQSGGGPSDYKSKATVSDDDGGVVLKSMINEAFSNNKKYFESKDDDPMMSDMAIADSLKLKLFKQALDINIEVYKKNILPPNKGTEEQMEQRWNYIMVAEELQETLKKSGTRGLTFGNLKTLGRQQELLEAKGGTESSYDVLAESNSRCNRTMLFPFGKEVASSSCSSKLNPIGLPFNSLDFTNGKLKDISNNGERQCTHYITEFKKSNNTSAQAEGRSEEK